MHRLGLLTVGASLLLAAPVADAQEAGTSMSGTAKAPPTVLPAQLQRVPAPPPVLFEIADQPFRLWAPVSVTYDSSANRSLAPDPLWVGAHPPVSWLSN